MQAKKAIEKRKNLVISTLFKLLHLSLFMYVIIYIFEHFLFYSCKKTITRPHT